ncbi:MAG: hypothetical protein ACRDSJ_03355 [Rubrobacteraceae bacterium]
MDGWGKVVAGVALGVAGTIYATNKKVREKLPGAARDLPENVQRRIESAVSAAREASANRKEEILRNLEAHTANHPPAREAQKTSPQTRSSDDETHPPSPS